MPTKFFTKLKYVSPITISGTLAGGCGVHVFSANGLYDPDITGSGAQPRGFDQLMAMFDHYVVAKAQINFECTTTDGTNNRLSEQIGICVRDSNSPETTIVEYLEHGWSKHQAVGRDAKGAKVSHEVSTLDFLGRTGLLSDPNLKGSASANPSEDVLFHVFVGSLVPAATTYLAYGYVTIIYDAWFIEPKDPGSS
jgi:hypothetical protein